MSIQHYELKATPFFFYVCCVGRVSQPKAMRECGKKEKIEEKKQDAAYCTVM